MIRQFAVIAIAVLGVAGCASPYESSLSSGASPANFSYKSDAANAKALLSAAETGQPALWQVSDSVRGAVTPTGGAYDDRAHRPCRQMKHERDGVGRLVTACKGGDGTWVVAEWSPDKAD